jgi:hypothetical protein
MQPLHSKAHREMASKAWQGAMLSAVGMLATSSFAEDAVCGAADKPWNRTIDDNANRGEKVWTMQPH